MDKVDIKGRIFKEKNLWDLLKVYESTFKKPFSAYTIALGAAVFTLCLLIPGQFLTSRATCETYITPLDVVKTLDFITLVGLNIGVGALSIAIAGFAIFASGLSDETVRLMIRNNQSGTTVSIMVYAFASFIYVMVSLFFLVVTSTTVIAIFSEKSAFRLLILGMFSKAHDASATIILTLYLSQLAFVLSILKSFIWNLYQTLLSVSAFRAIGKK